ncbi:hypothetical protein PHLCEN_2v12591 [Hermanssonia centrifuga]|uniref:Bromo domain-containing protein n=1 Tax=Hermanssonia centrifuga TaxID=98765 RepID=A0A2R6NGM4_9APHY|nr:hypothetical protein PHLCEN_2v12591 [Hermanssonia centrifuga]
MDLQTMLKKVKQKQYKSKREFKDDLDLIWSNCFTYNATEVRRPLRRPHAGLTFRDKNHPLRQCATRLKTKAETLLKNITDRKDRADPAIPAELASRSSTPKLNGTIVNGNGVARARMSFTKSPSPAKLPIGAISKQTRHVPVMESTIARTAEGMATFLRLDQQIEAILNGELPRSGLGLRSLEEELMEYAPMFLEENGGADTGSFATEAGIGEKRKLNGFAESRPRKRAKTTQEDKDIVDLWWDAMQSAVMIGNGVPTLRYSSSGDPSDTTPPPTITDPPRMPGQRARKKRRKQTGDVYSERSMLHHMNNNIRILRRVRSTHARLTALKESNDDAAGTGVVQPSQPSFEPLAADEVEAVVEDTPWPLPSSDVELGEENADHCLHWMGTKVLEHAGFQGASKVALDVLAGVTSDYLLNVGRTMRFMCDKYASKMTPEEIVLHTLFESGITRIHELERYINDDVVRYGGRLAELEKKLASAYREATVVEAWDDDALFKMEEDEEDGEFVMGNFADSFGEDFLGLRELGIAAEFGLSSLTVPKRLLKGKNKGNLQQTPDAKPSEPPPPFPPPPPFIQLDSKKVDDQIGLLKPFYQQRISALTVTAPPIPSISITMPGLPIPLNPFGPPAHHTAQAADYPLVALPDDPPSGVHTKLGPLGQVIKTGTSANATKKKAVPAKTKGIKDAADGDGAETPLTATTPTATAPDTPKKPKGSGKKKKGSIPVDVFPAVMMTSTSSGGT